MERSVTKKRRISVTVYRMSGCLYNYLRRSRTGASRRGGEYRGDRCIRVRVLRGIFLEGDTMLEENDVE